MDHQHPLRLTDGILRFRGPGSVHLHRPRQHPPPSKKKRMFRSRATPKLRGIEAAPRPSNPCSSTWAKWRVGVCGVASVVDLALVGWLWGFVISTTPERKKGHLVQQQQQQHHHIYSVCPDHGIEGVHLQAGRFRGSPNVFQSKGLDKRGMTCPKAYRSDSILR